MSTWSYVSPQCCCHWDFCTPHPESVYFSLSALLSWALANIMDHRAFFLYILELSIFVPTQSWYSLPRVSMLWICVQSEQHKVFPALRNNQAVSHLLTSMGITRQVRRGPDQSRSGVILTEMFHKEGTYLEVCFAAVESLKLQYDTPFKFIPPLTRGLSIWSWAGPPDGRLGPILPRSQPWVVLL